MNKSKTFCILPFIHLATHPSGHCSLCCIADHTNMESFAKNGQKILNLKNNSVEEIMNSDYYKEVRKQMLSGEAPKACRPCFDNEERGIRSKRQEENKKYSRVIDDAIDNLEDGRLKKIDLRYLELRLGNTCNVRCRSCNPNSSSQWSKDYTKLIKINSFIEDRYSDSLCEFKWPDRQEFWDGVKRCAPKVQEIYINGGEPTLIKRHWQFLEDLVAEGRAHRIKLWYSINMTRLPEDKIEIWKEFKDVRIEASIDDLDHRNFYIRHPTKWDDVLESIERLEKHDINWGVMQTISPMNIFYLPEFFKWANENYGARVSYNFVRDPYYLDVKHMPWKVKWAIMERFTNMIGIEWWPAKAHEACQMLKNKEDPDHWDKFCEFNRSLDQLRGESFKETFPEFVELLTDCKVEIP